MFGSMKELKDELLKGERFDFECKEAESTVPRSAYESYSSFANTNGGVIVLGIKEVRKAKTPEERFIIQGIKNPQSQINDFWNTINGSKVNVNILSNDDVYTLEENDLTVIVINVPRADYNLKPVYVGENPYKGTFKRNNEGDYHATEDEIKSMIRDQNPDGNDSLILEYYTMDDIDPETLRAYRQMFVDRNPDHVWSSLNDKEFLKMLGGYRVDRKNKVEGLTMAGLLMFGKGLPIRDEFDNIFMDYRDESNLVGDARWSDRVTYDGTWENNLFNFFTKVTRKLTADLKKPFAMEGMQRIDDDPLRKAIREAFVNAIIHSDYQMDAGVLKIIKKDNGFTFTNPGVLKLPKEEIYKGGNSKARNPKMQTMLRMIGFGDNAGSGFPLILDTWKANGWKTPELDENPVLNQVTLSLEMEKTSDKKQAIKTSDKKQATKTESHKANIIKFLKDNGESKVSDIASAIGLKNDRTRVLLLSMPEVVSLGNNKNRTYRLK